MNRAKLILLVLCIPLCGFTCAYSVRDISVAPSYLAISRGQYELDLLVKDYEEVVAALTEWAKNTEFTVGHCPLTGTMPDFGMESPAVFYLCGKTTKIEVVMFPEYNSTRVTFYDGQSFEVIDKVVPEIKSFLKSKFGEGSVIEHQYNP